MTNECKWKRNIFQNLTKQSLFIFRNKTEKAFSSLKSAIMIKLKNWRKKPKEYLYHYIYSHSLLVRTQLLHSLLGLFLASYKYCLNEKTEKRKSLILIIEASFLLFFKVGVVTIANCVFFSLLEKLGFFFIF